MTGGRLNGALVLVHMPVPLGLTSLSFVDLCALACSNGLTAHYS